MALEGMAQRTPTNLHCHPDPFGAAQGMLREGSRRMAMRHRRNILMVQCVPTNTHCHPDPFGAAQGMLREGSRRMSPKTIVRRVAAMLHGVAPRKR
jgi:hypothetical protein